MAASEFNTLNPKIPHRNENGPAKPQKYSSGLLFRTTASVASGPPAVRQINGLAHIFEPGGEMRTALICILIAGLLPYFWTAVAKVVGARYDNRNVREWQAKLSGPALRAHYAHLNAFEAFPFFAAAMLAAMITNADRPRVSALAVAFLVARMLHGVAYVFSVAIARSLIWFIGIGCVIAIMFAAIRSSS